MLTPPTFHQSTVHPCHPSLPLDRINLAESQMLTDEQISELRSHFPILREKTYLYNCSQGALSDAVEAGMQKYAASWRTSTAPWDEWMGAYGALRGAFAQFINAQPEEVAIVA